MGKSLLVFAHNKSTSGPQKFKNAKGLISDANYFYRDGKKNSAMFNTEISIGGFYGIGC